MTITNPNDITSTGTRRNVPQTTTTPSTPRQSETNAPASREQVQAYKNAWRTFLQNAGYAGNIDQIVNTLDTESTGSGERTATVGGVTIDLDNGLSQEELEALGIRGQFIEVTAEGWQLSDDGAKQTGVAATEIDIEEVLDSNTQVASYASYLRTIDPSLTEAGAQRLSAYLYNHNNLNRRDATVETATRQISTLAQELQGAVTGDSPENVTPERIALAINVETNSNSQLLSLLQGSTTWQEVATRIIRFREASYYSREIQVADRPRDLRAQNPGFGIYLRAGQTISRGPDQLSLASLRTWSEEFSQAAQRPAESPTPRPVRETPAPRPDTAPVTTPREQPRTLPRPSPRPVHETPTHIPAHTAGTTRTSSAPTPAPRSRTTPVTTPTPAPAPRPAPAPAATPAPAQTQAERQGHDNEQLVIDRQVTIQQEDRMIDLIEDETVRNTVQQRFMAARTSHNGIAEARVALREALPAAIRADNSRILSIGDNMVAVDRAIVGIDQCGPNPNIRNASLNTVGQVLQMIRTMPAGERRENALHLLTQLGTALRANNLRQIPARIESALQALRLLRVNDLFTLFREGRELHEQDNYEGALQKFEIIRFFEPSSPINYSILVCRAEIAYAHQDYAAALPLFQEIQRSPLAPDRIRESVARQIADCQNQIHPNSPSAQVLTRALVNALGRGRVTFHIDRSSITISNGTVRVRDGLNFREGAEQILNVISCSNISAEQANSLLRELQDVARFNSAPIGTEVRFNFRAQGQTPVITWPAVSR